MIHCSVSGNYAEMLNVIRRYKPITFFIYLNEKRSQDIHDKLVIFFVFIVKLCLCS